VLSKFGLAKVTKSRVQNKETCFFFWFLLLFAVSLPTDNDTVCANDEAIVLIPDAADFTLGNEGTVGGPKPRLDVYELHVGQ
jgi:hypothetical protein